MKILNVNEKYRAIAERNDTAVIIKEPVINDYGFDIRLAESVGGRRLTFDLYVKARRRVTLNKDLIAVIMAALVLKKFKRIYFDFDVGENALKEIKAVTGAEIEAKETREDFPRQPGTKRSLNFSGGMDSAALRLACPDMFLTSVDFKDEAHEKETRRNLNSNIVETNANEFVFPHYSAGYYNLGSLLFSETEGIGLAANGKLMTDSERTLGYLDGFYPSPIDAPDEVYGVKLVFPLIGMTMIGTRKLVQKLKPKLRGDVVKAQRWITPQKEILRAELDEALFKEKRKLPEARPVPYSYSPPYNFYALYLLKKLGEEKAAMYVSDIPEEAAELAKSLKMDFYEKYDPRALRDVPEDFADYFLSRIKEAGMELYTEEDYAERSRILEVISAEEEL